MNASYPNTETSSVKNVTHALSLQQASVAYRCYQRPYHALLEWLFSRQYHEVFYALQDINLALEPGVALGIVGDNGAGKSTLLRLLAGNLSPGSGSCQVNGSRSALLELGAGVHSELSGLENIRLGLAMRGLSTQAITTGLPQVAAFAELGDFISKPVKHYSSGMLVRLLFAVAVHLRPDILIVDEALAVGDQYFQKKSLDRMRAILEQGTTLVFCSHNLYQIREICQQAVWLEQGRVRLFGEAQAVTDAYQDAVRARSRAGADSGMPVGLAVPTSLTNRALAADSTDISGVSGSVLDTALSEPTSPESRSSLQNSPPILASITLEGGHIPDEPDEPAGTDAQHCFVSGDYFAVNVQVATATQDLSDVHVGIVLRRNDDLQCFGISTLHDGVYLQACGAQQAMIRFVIEQLPLLAGQYCLEVWLIDGSGVHVYDARERCCHFKVQQASQACGVGVSRMAYRWEADNSLCIP